MTCLDGIIDSIDMNLSKFQEIVKDREAWHAAVHGGHRELDTTEQLNKSQNLQADCLLRGNEEEAKDLKG